MIKKPVQEKKDFSEYTKFHNAITNTLFCDWETKHCIPACHNFLTGWIVHILKITNVVRMIMRK